VEVRHVGLKFVRLTPPKYSRSCGPCVALWLGVLRALQRYRDEICLKRYKARVLCKDRRHAKMWKIRQMGDDHDARNVGLCNLIYR
jgi:hypothetical protein